MQELKEGSSFRSIEIVMHEERVTQIEKCEKLRVYNSAATPRRYNDKTKCCCIEKG